MTGREASDRELRILEEAGLPEDPALLHVVRDLRALGDGPAPEASADLAQLMADSGKAPQGRRNKRRITFLGGALAVSMGVGMSGVAAGTLHLPQGLGDAVDSIARFSVHHDPDRHDPDRHGPAPADPAPAVVAPSVESPAGVLAVPVPPPSAIAGVPIVPVAADPTGPGDASDAGFRTVTPEVPSVGGRTAPGAPPAMPAVPPVAVEKPPVGQAPPAPGTPPAQDLRPATVPGGRVPAAPTGETPPGDHGRRQGQVDQGKLQDRNTVRKDGTVQDDGRGQDTQAEGVVSGTGPERGHRDVRRSFAGPDPSWRLTPVEPADEPMFLTAPFADDAGMSLFLADADILADADVEPDAEPVIGPASGPSGDAAPAGPVTVVVSPADPVTVVVPPVDPVTAAVVPPDVEPPAPVAEDG